MDRTERDLRLARMAVAKTTARAHDLRCAMSPPEIVLWSRLRRRGLNGLRFRRQHPIGPFIADFYCHEARLVVEVDSTFHNTAADAERDRWMGERGLLVLRVPVLRISRDIDNVLENILRAVEAGRDSQHP